MRARIHLVSDPADDIATLRCVEALVDADPQRVLIRLTPGRGRMRSLNADVAEGLGRKRGYYVARSDFEGWSQLAAWFIADEINEIFVDRAHQLGVDQCERLIEFANLCDADLWLLAQMEPLPPKMRTASSYWPMETVSAEAFRQKWNRSAAKCGTQPHSKQVRAPQPRLLFEVPQDEFFTFWDAARELLEPDQFAALDRVFQDALMRTRCWLSDAKPVDAERVAAYLRALMSEAGDRSVALTRLRAAQAAFFEHWFLVKASFDRLTGSLFANPPMGLSNEAALVLKRVPSAREAALATIALATPLEPIQVHALRLANVATDGSFVASGDQCYEIPTSGARFLRAHRLVRLFHGARPDDQLFGCSRDRDGSELSLKAMQAVVQHVARETGLFLAAHWTKRGLETNHRWIARRGITLQRLTRAPEAK